MAKRKPADHVQFAQYGDCVKLFQASTKKYDLIVADPPYNFGMPYEAYDDNKSYEAYMKWTDQWLGAALSRLAPHGSMFIFVPDEWVTEIDYKCTHHYQLYKRRHILWAFTFGQKAHRNFTRSHCHILYYTKTKTRFTFNEDAVKVPSARQLVYNDPRAAKGGKPPDATWMLLKEQLEPYMTPDTDTWLVSRICGTYKEREKHSPNQIPVPITARIVRACSNPGDWVCDPFCGTGSSGVACAGNSRNWDGFDVGRNCVKQSQRRINEVRKLNGLGKLAALV